MASADILRAARARIEDPKNWTQGAFARAADQTDVPARSKDAVCWCVFGAIEAAGGNQDEESLVRVVSYRLTQLLPAEANDTLGHPAVLQMLDAAIAAAEAEAGR